MNSFEIYLIIFFYFFVFTILSSMAGIGASFLIIPVFLYYNFNFALVSAYGLIFNLSNTSTASIRHFKQRSIDFKISVPIILVSAIASPIGALMINLIDSKILLLIFSITMIMIGFNILYRIKNSNLKEMEYNNSILIYFMAIMVGFLIGLFFGLLGIGGGFIALLFLMYIGLEIKTTAGTTSFIIAFSAFFALISKIMINNLEFDIVIISTGIVISIFGAYIGSYGLHFKLNPVQIKFLISILVLFIGFKMLFSIFASLF